MDVQQDEQQQVVEGDGTTSPPLGETGGPPTPL